LTTTSAVLGPDAGKPEHAASKTAPPSTHESMRSRGRIGRQALPV
jgi:hypothetical protein